MMRAAVFAAVAPTGKYGISFSGFTQSLPRVSVPATLPVADQGRI
ncbi:hypothetical protein V8G57_24640 [Collimonas sp. H4R21]|uniref:Uncharacterized protein n=1 Tax=Collimonas rhizosphaerae TaxID=3126357 RepID=A0ABU9Q2V2_9BURK